MILTKRKFVREAPLRTAKSVYIFCEGAKREYQYFDYFKEMDSRINVEVYKLDPSEDNSPKGLLSIAKKSILKSDTNQNPKYIFQENDEVWLIVDTDKDKHESRKVQITSIKEEIKKNKDWNIVESNPCFEVWLYYHEHKTKPRIENEDKCSSWKELVNQEIKGGFDSRRHPIYIEDAVMNSEINYDEDENGTPFIGSSQMHILAKSILPIVKTKIDKVIYEMKNEEHEA